MAPVGERPQIYVLDRAATGTAMPKYRKKKKLRQRIQSFVVNRRTLYGHECTSVYCEFKTAPSLVQ